MANSFRCEVEETCDYDFLGCYINRGFTQPSNFLIPPEFSLFQSKGSLMQSRCPIGSCWDATSANQDSARMRLPNAASAKSAMNLATNSTSTITTIALQVKNGKEMIAIADRNMFVGFYKGMQREWKQLFRGNKFITSATVNLQKAQFAQTVKKLKIFKVVGEAANLIEFAVSGHEFVRDPTAKNGFKVSTGLLFMVVPMAATAGAITAAPGLLVGMAVTLTVAAVSDAVTGRDYKGEMHDFLVDQTFELMFEAHQAVFKN